MFTPDVPLDKVLIAVLIIASKPLYAIAISACGKDLHVQSGLTYQQVRVCLPKLKVAVSRSYLVHRRSDVADASYGNQRPLQRDRSLKESMNAIMLTQLVGVSVDRSHPARRMTDSIRQLAVTFLIASKLKA